MAIKILMNRNLAFFCKAASNVGPYGLFWQPALVLYSSILGYIFVFIDRANKDACLLASADDETSRRVTMLTMAAVVVIRL